jgi:hypothetical protein
MYGHHWIRNLNELLDNPANQASSGFATDKYIVNELGYVVTKASYHTPSEVPIAYVDPTGNSIVKIGDVNPNFSWAWTHDLRYRDLGLHLQLDGVSGGQIYNYAKQYGYAFARGADLDQANVFPVEARKPDPFFHTPGFYDGRQSNDRFVEDGTYAKIREISLSYALSDRLRNMLGLGKLTHGVKVAVVGRNLKTFTKYSGTDPELISSGEFNYRNDAFQYPILRTYSAQFTVTY